MARAKRLLHQEQIVLLEDILNFSKIEREAMEKSSFDLIDLFYTCFTEYKIETEARKIDVTINVPDFKQLFIWVDQDKMWMVFNNLISNAIKYTENQWIEIDIKEREQGLVSQITNGANIGEIEIIEQIWPPFYVGEVQGIRKIQVLDWGLQSLKRFLTNIILNMVSYMRTDTEDPIFFPTFGV